MKVPARLLPSLVLLLLAGCAAEEVRTERYFWPRPPDRPRIEWIASYSSQLDLPRTPLRRFKEATVGADSPIPFSRPIDIRSDGEGLVYVADIGAGAVFVYDMVAREVRFTPKDASRTRLRMPVALALDADGALYVADRFLNAVAVFNRDGEHLRTIRTQPHIERIAALAVDRRNRRLLVTDTKGQKVGVFTLDGGFLFSFGKSGGGDGEFSFPVALALNSRGEIVVADAMNARVQIFDPEGRFLRKFGRRGDRPGDFQQIKGVAVDSDDNIYVTDGRAHRLAIFSDRGDFLLSLGGYYSIATGKIAPGGFVFPQGIDIDKNDTIYVADQMNSRFQVFQYLSEGYIREHPVPGVPRE